MKRKTILPFLLIAILFLFHHSVWSQQNYLWNGSASGAWNNPANWTPNGIPGASDTITVNSGTCDFTGSGNLEFGGIYLSTNINATDTIRVKSKMHWTGGRWSGGALNMVTGSILTLDDRFTKSLFNGALINDGKIIWNGTGNFELTNGAVFINNSLMELRNNSSLLRGYGIYPKFTNSASGTISKLNPGTKTILGNTIEFLNNGRIEVNEGLLEIRSPGTYSGNVEVLNGSLLRIGEGSQTWTGTSSLITNGALEIISGSGGAVIDFQGNLDVSAKTTISSGTFNISGSVTNLGDSLFILRGGLQIASGSINVPNITFVEGTFIANSTVSVSNLFDWSGGQILGSDTVKIMQNALLQIQGNKYKNLRGGHILNMGKLIWEGTGDINISDGGVLINTGLMELRNNSSLVRGYGILPKFTNSASGIIRKLNPGTKTILGNFIEFLNDGRIEVQEGLLEIRSPGIYSGSVEVLNGSLLRIGEGSQTWTSTSSLVSNGALEVVYATGGTGIDFRGTLDIATKTMAYGGVTKVSGSTTNLGDSLIISKGTFQVDSVNINVSVISIDENGKLIVNSNVTAETLLDWTNGDILGNDTLFIPANALAHLHSKNPKRLKVATLYNSGKILWEGTGDLNLYDGSVLANNNLFEINNNATIINGGQSMLLNLKTGVIRKSKSSGTTVFGKFDNAGLTEIQSGTLELQGQGIHTGKLITADSTVLKFTNGRHDFNPGFTLDVAGKMIITGRFPNLYFNEDYVLPPGMILNNLGSIGGSGVVTVADTMYWAGGALRDTARFVIDSTGVLVVTGANNSHTLDKRNLINKGKILVKEGRVGIYKNAVINNYGIIEISDNAGITGSVFNAPFINHSAGKIIILPGSTRTDMGVMHLQNYGYIEVNERPVGFSTNYFIGRFTQYDGETRLNNCKIFIKKIYLDGGVLSGSGTIEGNLDSKGTIDPGIDSTRFGLIYIRGDYVQDTSAVLKIDIGGRSPGSGYDQLTTNTAKLAGLLDLQFNSSTDSTFSAYSGVKFRVIRWVRSSYTGKFDSITNLEYTVFKRTEFGGFSPTPEKKQLDVVYSPTSLIIYRGDVNRDLWLQFVGRDKVRPGGKSKIKLYYSNPTGDTLDYPLIITLKGDMVMNQKSQISHYPDQIPWEPPVDAAYFGDQVPKEFVDGTGADQIISIPIIFSVPPTQLTGSSSGGGPAQRPYLTFTGKPNCQGTNPSVEIIAGDPLNGQSSEDCYWEIADFVLGFIPGGECAKAGLKLVTGLFRESTNYARGGKMYSWGKWVPSAGWEAAKCAVSFIPGATLVTKTVEVLDIIMSGASNAGALNSCISALMPDRNGNMASISVRCVASKDPNEKVGPEGVTDMRYIKATNPAAYTIYFENVDSATAPAQNVYITDQLDPSKWDFGTFSFLPITIGDTTIEVPFDVPSFEKVVDLTDRVGVLVRITATLDELTGSISWKFVSLDPATYRPVTDPLAGFLPPNVTYPEGQGDVGYIVEPNADLPSGTPLGGDAVIVFDNNAPIHTNEWINHIENTAPVSHMTPGQVVIESGDYLLTWSGSDDHSGINGYDLYYSVNDSPFEKLLATRDTSYLFAGDPCNTYRFYTVAVDSARNHEPPKAPEVELTVNPYLASSINLLGDSTLCSGDSTLLWVSYDSLLSYTWYRDGNVISQDTAVYVKKGGSYVVDIYRDSTCSFSIGPVIINRDSINAPTISQAENVLSVPDVYASYQWYLDDSPIAGATAASISAKEIGYYKVLVSNLQGCEILSDPFFYQITGLQDPQFNALSVYPNPGTNELYLKFGEGLNKPSTLEMLDISGHIVLQQSIQPLKEGEKLKIDIRTLKSGIYLIRVWNSNNMTLLKFMKE